MISIIVPCYNQLELTQACLKSIAENTRDYEIIIVDNGSNPAFFPPSDVWLDVTAIGGNREYISCVEDSSNIKVIRNETNLGYPVAINQGIRKANGDVIILLNNDCIVSKGWAFWLLHHLETFSIVGPVTNYCAGMQRVMIPVYNDEQELAREAEKWLEEHAGKSEEVNWVIGFCMAFKRSLYDEIGPFDESFWPCCGEEVDFCLKARAAGHKVGIARGIYIHHFGSQTFEAMERAGELNYNVLNSKTIMLLSKKWGKGFWQNQKVLNEDH